MQTRIKSMRYFIPIFVATGFAAIIKENHRLHEKLEKQEDLFNKHTSLLSRQVIEVQNKPRNKTKIPVYHRIKRVGAMDPKKEQKMMSTKITREEYGPYFDGDTVIVLDFPETNYEFNERVLKELSEFEMSKGLSDYFSD